MPIPQDAAGHTQHEPAVAADQLGEGGLVLLRGEAAQQFAIGRDPVGAGTEQALELLKEVIGGRVGHGGPSFGGLPP